MELIVVVVFAVSFPLCRYFCCSSTWTRSPSHHEWTFIPWSALL